jgi:hypothetical protein
MGDLHEGFVADCYSIGRVSGDSSAGGLMDEERAMEWEGWRGCGWAVIQCFWDTQTSGADWSAGGTGKTTAEMQTAKTFLDAGWDFVGETANGTEDIWKIAEGLDYPRLWWETTEE